MRLILNLPQPTIENMQGYCQTHNIPLDSFINDLFNEFIQTPARMLDEHYMKHGNLDDFYEFAKLLEGYLDEAINDIESLSLSEESYNIDKPMAEVFKAMRDILRSSTYMQAYLFVVWSNQINKEDSTK